MVTSTSLVSSDLSLDRSGLDQMMKGAIIIEGKDGRVPEQIHFHYNPSSYSVSKKADWGEHGTAPGENAERFTFNSVKSAELTLNNLIFDSYDIGGDVRKTTDKLFKLVQIDKNETPPRPPYCRFSWGNDSGKVKNTEFKAFVGQVDVEFILFLMRGTPCRAKVSLMLKEISDTKPGQNPTTQGTYGNQIHLVKPGETLNFISNIYYGTPSMWRLLADANGLSDPTNIRVGEPIEIVPIEN
jgi:hypothetical protein